MAATMDSFEVNVDPALNGLNVRLVIEIRARVFWYCYLADIGASLALGRPEFRFKGNVSCVTPSKDAIWALDDAELSRFDDSKLTLLGYTSDEHLRDASPSKSPIWKEVVLVYKNAKSIVQDICSIARLFR